MAAAIFAVIEDTGVRPFVGDFLYDGTGTRIHLDELDSHPGRVLRARVGFFAPPHHAAHSMDEGRLVLKHELELQKRTHGQGLLGLDEYAPPRNVAAVAFDEVLERGALVADLQRKQRALVLACVCHVLLSGTPN